MQRYCNHSKFNGSRYTPSRYSEVRCRRCAHTWRTLASVDHLPDWEGDDQTKAAKRARGEVQA